MSQLQVYPLPYTANLIDQYQAYIDLPGFVLLDSADQQSGRYDIMTALPYDQFVITNTTPHLNLAWLELKQKLTFNFDSDLDFPFQGGAIGYISYDFGARLAGINSKLHPSIAHLPLVDLKFYDWAIIADHQLKQVHLIASHQNSETTIIVQDMLNRWTKPNKHMFDFNLRQAFSTLISQHDYHQAFHSIQQALLTGRSYQVNLTQPFLSNYEGNAWEAYKRIRRHNPVPFSAFLRLPEDDILSFSPERFLSFEKGQVLASPIKGTIKRSPLLIEDQRLKHQLQTSEKDRAENVMIVDLLRNDLSKIAQPASVNVTALFDVISFQSIHHLVSHIEAKSREDVVPMDVFSVCFPGGSITGAPKLEAMKIIHEQEKYARGVYCGCIGYFSQHGRFDMNIAIRTLIATHEQLYMAAGGGIVIDSQCEAEYQECFTKIQAIINGLI